MMPTPLQKLLTVFAGANILLFFLTLVFDSQWTAMLWFVSYPFAFVAIFYVKYKTRRRRA